MPHYNNTPVLLTRHISVYLDSVSLNSLGELHLQTYAEMHHWAVISHRIIP